MAISGRFWCFTTYLLLGSPCILQVNSFVVQKRPRFGYNVISDIFFCSRMFNVVYRPAFLLAANETKSEVLSDANDSVFSRFTSPRLDDPFLPLVDVSVAQIVAPSMQVLWLSLQHAPTPSWLRPLSSNLYAARGSLVAPTLIHGAALASCWLVGALAAQAYRKEAIVPESPRDYRFILWTVCQAGAFATGILIFATQLDLLLEFGRYVQPGESPETDLRLLTAFVELLDDIFFEATCLILWRLYLATQNARF
jgi:hypothetical protein